MKIYEALAEVKTLKTTADELSKFRESSLAYDADSQPDFKFDQLSEQIDKTMERIADLKIAIQFANLETKVTAGDKEMTLARAILELGAIRLKLSSLSSMAEENRRGRLFANERRSKDEVPQRTQKSKADLLEMQLLYRKRRDLLDSVIQEANHKIEIMA